ncbi:MAG: polyprenyl synthetase family protein [Planctomycetes bacterium]|nr:polyprenyl synthetase family protein [Planctomycetota bacterium]MCP4771823.1 polyprenyl synthetase family protein [Planctomycetota bacterium]MCP4860932.1 polyprenyl synthetase family protein [Planctomycetota bacterium]
MPATKSDFRQFLDQVRPAVDQALEQALSASALPGVPANLQQPMAYALLGNGKRVRPALCLLAAEAHGGDSAVAMPAALACEMIHAYSLIHDDLPCMDDDDLRRGRPTVHVKFSEATAVLAGDALQTLAFQTLASQEHGSLAAAQVQTLARAAGPAGMVGGQQLDMDAEGQTPDLEAILQLHGAKTGALLNASLRLGAISAGADSQIWHGYAESVGRLFQITDDIIDATSTTAELGKTAGKDSTAGKATVVAALGLEGARALAASEVQAALAALDEIAPSRRYDELADLPRFLGTRST